MPRARGDTAAARLLVEGGANVNDHDAGSQCDDAGGVFGFGETARYLIDKGADPNNDMPGFTALHCAIMRRDEETAAALLAHGANPNTPVKVRTPTRRASDDYYFQPALVDATRTGSRHACRTGGHALLAKHGADTKVIHESNYVQGEGYARRKERTTALMAALGMGGGTAWMPVDRAVRDALVLETVKLALDLGADVNVANVDGRTALDSARAQKMPAVVTLLESHGAIGKSQ